MVEVSCIINNVFKLIKENFKNLINFLTFFIIKKNFDYKIQL